VAENFLFLMAVAFLEFPTSLVGHYSEEQVSVVIYALNAAVASLLLSAISWYAARGHRLVVYELDDEEERVRRLQGLAVPVVFLLSKGVSFLRAPWRRRCTPPGCSCPSQTPSSVGCGPAKESEVPGVPLRIHLLIVLLEAPLRKDAARQRGLTQRDGHGADIVIPLR
jgi:hypothetical protein